VLTPELTEGPFYQDLDLVRSNITEGLPGTPLLLQLTVENPSCAPIPGAIVDIWHTDATGTYSGAKAGLPDATFMRGSQVADTDGLVVFETIHPGWYSGRATHIHVKVHVGGRAIHTGQLFFNEALNNAVYATAPYAKTGTRVLNAYDGIFLLGGSATIVSETPATLGYLGKQTLVVT
jgi:protocatechuate 3,4-dioxygenase beta subunit